MSINKSDIDKKKRLVPAVQRPKTLIRPHIDVMLADSYVILKRQLDMLRERALTEELELADLKRMKILTDQLANLAREEREQGKDRYNYTDMDDADIVELIPQALKALGGSNADD